MYHIRSAQLNHSIPFKPSSPQHQQQSLPTLVQPNDFVSQSTTYRRVQQQELGHGTYGSVILVQDLRSHNYLAMKIICKQTMQLFYAEENIRQELLIQTRLNCQNILKIVESFEDAINLYIILEYCQRGNLCQLVRRRGKLTEDETFHIFYQVMLGVDYLHKNGIVHRDIKPDNILLTQENVVKICDFNWAIKLKNDEKAKPVLCGTTEYMPPEVVAKQVHDTKTDIWSLGVMFYELIHGKQPFTGSNPTILIGNILGNQNLEVSESISVDCYILIHAMLSRMAHQRPTCEQIFLSKWMKQMMKKFELSCPYQQTRLTQSMSQYDLVQKEEQNEKSSSDVKPVKKIKQMHQLLSGTPMMKTDFKNHKTNDGQFITIPIVQAAPEPNQKVNQ